MRDQIHAALKDAMLAKDKLRTSTLRLMLAAIRDQDIALRGEEGGGGLDEPGLMALLMKMVKQREDSAATYDSAGRMEMAEAERAEIGVIKEFLPRPMPDAEIEAAIKAAIAETGAASIRDMGKVMGALKAQFAGRMDFAVVGPRVKALLG